jgi:predicted MFS family arabinose efflux permease
MKIKLAVTASAIGISIIAVNGWPAAFLGCIAILSVLICVMLILSRPELLAAAKPLLESLRDLFR